MQRTTPRTRRHVPRQQCSCRPCFAQGRRRTRIRSVKPTVARGTVGVSRKGRTRTRERTKIDVGFACLRGPQRHPPAHTPDSTRAPSICCEGEHPNHETHFLHDLVVLQRTCGPHGLGGEIRMVGEGSQEGLELDVGAERITGPLGSNLLQLLPEAGTGGRHGGSDAGGGGRKLDELSESEGKTTLDPTCHRTPSDARCAEAIGSASADLSPVLAGELDARFSHHPHTLLLHDLAVVGYQVRHRMMPH